MTSTYSKELIEYEEQIADAELSDINHQLALLSSKNALTTLQKTSSIDFDPTKDVAITDSLLHVALAKFHEISGIDIARELEDERRDVLLEIGGEELPAKLGKTRSAIVERMFAEKALSGTLKTYADMITRLLKEKRMLAGHAYGSQAQQSANVPRLIQVRKSMMKLEGPGSRGNNLTIPVNELNPQKALPATSSVPVGTYPKG